MRKWRLCGTNFFKRFWKIIKPTSATLHRRWFRRTSSFKMLSMYVLHIINVLTSSMFLHPSSMHIIHVCTSTLTCCVEMCHPSRCLLHVYTFSRCILHVYTFSRYMLFVNVYPLCLHIVQVTRYFKLDVFSSISVCHPFMFGSFVHCLCICIYPCLSSHIYEHRSLYPHHIIHW